MIFTNESELYHHGIIGMKWGVRRYQNKDGSLTPAGRRRYLSDPSASYKRLKKEIRDKRQEQYGLSNRWDSSNPIGPESTKFKKDYDSRVKSYYNSKEYKQYEKKWKQLDDQYESGKIDDDQYQNKADELSKNQPKRNFDPGVYVYGKGFADDFINGDGGKRSIAALKDLGYNQKAAEEIVEKLKEKKLTLGMA